VAISKEEKLMEDMRTPQMISFVGNSFAIFIPHKIAKIDAVVRKD